MRWYYLDVYGESENELFEKVASMGLEGVGFPCEGKAHLRVYFYSSGERDRVAELLKSSFQVEFGEEDDKDWVRQVEEGYEPVRAGRFVVVPSSLTPIVIKPGMAFGTGYHSSTRIALKLIDNEVDKVEGLSVDIGCGSGILTIALYKKGIKPILAIDNDLLALRETRENLKRNGIEDGVLIVGGDILSFVRENVKFSLVVANLVMPLFEVCLGEITQYIEKGGLFIASGVSIAEKAPFLKLLEHYSFKIKALLEEDGWIGAAAVFC
ncbi:MAG: 50S ribosomal protein L11 methyltransferase [Synergistetes bacterium]|nr:50S ribosomal protein L11 methyltransferase [Synergistota bacterium]MCX8128360.1 50S ribosomal protein L11 methyltransferase [Synergistota bacterium]MDW8192982.1 50S ribosomal protein L11 methyltransferase [Synergistota bacterium]